MCGIVAISSHLGSDYSIENSLNAIKHRGPDDQGVFTSSGGDCRLGQVRLSILDLSHAGHQPMVDDNERYVISYNGEIYNYRELKSHLEDRYGSIVWRSNTDTEVIVEGFAREGISFLDRLNGIFAISIYDKENHLLHVLRDPIGVKPLFIANQEGACFFCSELKGLLAISHLNRTIRRESLADQLAFMYIPEPYTLYHEFKKLEPGVCFTYQYGKLISKESLFSHLVAEKQLITETDAVQELRNAFSTAVRRQLISDVPVSMFLSGGLDSSAVAWQVVHGGANIKDAYTIAYSEDDLRHDAQSDDLYYAKLMAKQLGLELNVIYAKQDFLSLLPELYSYMEDGFTDPAALNTYLICKSARNNGVKVMLSGQGADEYLGGYRRYLAEKMLQNIPAPLRVLLSKLGGLLPEMIPGRFNALNRRTRRLAYLAGQSSAMRILGMYSWASQEDIENLFIEPLAFDYGDNFIKLFESYSEHDVVDAMMELDHHYDLMSLNLSYTDRMSMAVGVEARVPFLDHDLVRVMNSIPAKLKVRGRHGKYVFKKAMEPYLPHDVVYREKAGFGLPIRAWMMKSKGLLEYYLSDERLERQGIFNVAAVNRLIKEQYSGEKDRSHILFTLLIQQIWLESNAIH